MTMSPAITRMARATSEWEAKKLVQGQRAYESGNKLKAAQYFQMILQRNPKCWPAVFSYAVLAHTICEHGTAVHHLRRMTAAVPEVPEAWYNLGTILQCVGEYAEAAACLERAVAIDAGMVNARINLGNAYLGLGRTDDAFAAYTEALGYTPNNAEATWNLSHYYVLTGQWANGWACYEARWQIPGFTEMNAITVAEGADAPLPWRGAPLAGKRLLVVEEQGYGDWLMCLRYAGMLREMGATVTWACRPEMLRLTAATVVPDAVVSIREGVPPADYVVACMTLHHRLGTTPERIPHPDGYLRAA